MRESRSSAVSGHSIECFHDGACPLCAREVAWLARRDRRGRIRFIDIAAPGFDAGAWGRTQAELEGSLHVRLVEEDRFVDGVESFRRLYAAVGLGWLLAATRWPGLRGLFDWLYSVFARSRPLLPGRRAPALCDDRCAPPRR
jgi:predicted DCC family thiol-disulfide oxidoreductase YuxK